MKKKSRDRLLLWMGAVLCLAYLLPNHYSPWLSVHQELVAAIAFVPLLLWASVRFCGVPFLAAAAAGLSLVPLLQMSTGKLYFSGDGWMSALYLVGFALTVIAGARYVKSAESQSASLALASFAPLWTGVVFAALLSVGIAAFQWLLLGNQGIYTAEMPPGGRPFANLAQPNQLATLLLLGMAGLLFLWEAQKLRAGFALAGALMLVFGLVMTGSRSVLLTLAWLLPAYGLMRRRCHLRTSTGAVVVVVVFYGIASAVWAPLNDLLLLTSDAATAVDRLAEPGIRKVYWLSMVDALWRAPWTGYGWGQVGVAQTAIALDYPATHSFFDSAHNLFLDLALWNGLPVAALAVAGLVFWFVWQVHQCRDALAWTTLVAVALVFSHAMVEYPLNYAYFLLPVGLWMGALSTTYPSTLDKWTFAWPASMVRGGAVAASAGALILSTVAIIEYFPFEADWRLMNYQEARIGNLDPTEPPPAVILTHLHEFMKFSRTEAKPGMSEQDLEWMRRVSSRYAYASPMFRYALAQALNHHAEGAQQTLRKLCRMQTKQACRSARQHWSQLARGQHPQLASIPFPQDALAGPGHRTGSP